ncbi:MAG: hypothetical protein GF370_01270 [Candidatus Nealsonbacteria bacterium]|nr:hypothetical protein [Candidatus Nealsonbacteria bacterium]
MSVENFQQEVEKIKKTEGEIRGVGMQSYINFILQKEGSEGLQKLEERLSELGYPVDLRKIEVMKFYPLGMLGVMLVSIRDLFGYDEQKFREMGKFHIKTSILIRLSLKYFFSLDRVLKEIPGLWRKHLTIGELDVREVDKKNRKIVIRLKDYCLHPLHCQILRGYLEQAFRMAAKEEGECVEECCVHKGGEFHDFVITW